MASRNFGVFTLSGNLESFQFYHWITPFGNDFWREKQKLGFLEANLWNWQNFLVCALVCTLFCFAPTWFIQREKLKTDERRRKTRSASDAIIYLHHNFHCSHFAFWRRNYQFVFVQSDSCLGYIAASSKYINKRLQQNNPAFSRATRCQRPERPPGFGRPRKKGVPEALGLNAPWQTCWIFNEVLSKMAEVAPLADIYWNHQQYCTKSSENNCHT